MTTDKPRHDGEERDRMVQIEKLIADLQSIKDRFGNTCCYIRRGGLSWGAVALNRRDADEKFATSALGTEEVDALFEALKHGDADHHAWLREAIAAHFAGQPVPPARGSGNKETLIASQAQTIEALRAENEQLRNRVSRVVDNVLKSLDAVLAELGFRADSPARMKIVRVLKEHPNG